MSKSDFAHSLSQGLERCMVAGRRKPSQRNNPWGRDGHAHQNL